MHLISFSSQGWDTWDIEWQPLIRSGTPVLVDDDLRFEDEPGMPRPATVVNQWLRELPLNGATAQRTWRNNAGALRAWLVFLQARGVDPLGDRHEQRAAPSMNAEHRFAGALDDRWDWSTWNLHVSGVDQAARPCHVVMPLRSARRPRRGFR